MTYRDFKYLKRRTASDKILIEKAFNIAKNTTYDGYRRVPGSMVYRCFDKNSAVKHNEKSAKELHKPIIRKF